MKRDKLIALKEHALDRMLLCYGVFAGNKPPRPEHAVELHAHAAFVQALCAELGPCYTPQRYVFPDDIGTEAHTLIADMSKHAYVDAALQKRIEKLLETIVRRWD